MSHPMMPESSRLDPEDDGPGALLALALFVVLMLALVFAPPECMTRHREQETKQ